MKTPAIPFALSVLVCLSALPVLAAPCDSLASVVLPDTTVAAAQVVGAGQFSPPVRGGGASGNANPYKDLPNFCRVALTLKPSGDSNIKVEVWLPAGNWNGKLQVVGNGGWGGTISYSDMAKAVRAGYATASTDTGHEGNRGIFALDHPEQLIDFSWRSEHEMTVKSKSIVQAFYGRPASISYWNGCSTGGRQALKEAQKFPDDFDGIIAGAPANRTAIALWFADALLKEPESYIPPAKYPAIHQAVLSACDARDGLKDGLIEDPTKCHFDPQVLLCKGADGPACLTAPQVAAAKKVYSPATNPRTGKQLFYSLAQGAELDWAVLGGGPDPYIVHYDHYKYVVFKDPNWDWRTYNFDSDEARSELPEYNIMNATDPNLKPFFGHNGKLLVYQGWADGHVPTQNTIKYYEEVLETNGGVAKVSNNIRLFLAPGMGHCGGGEGPNEFDAVAALDQWVGSGKAPERIIASHRTNGTVDRTRPLCPYPQLAKYKGSGSIDDEANFVCRAP
jgi:feruloyl esterase